MKNMSPRLTHVLIIDSILILLFLIGAYHVMEKAMVGVSFTRTGEQLIVQKVLERAEGMELLPGDIFLAVNGHSVRHHEEVEFILDGLHIGDTVEVTVSRAGEIVSGGIQLLPYYSTAYMVIMLSVGSLFFAIGVFVLIRRPRERGARIFHWASICVAGIIMMTWGNYAIEPFGIGIGLRILFSTVYTFTPALFLHFTFIFPRDKLQEKQYVPVLLYGTASVITILMSIAFVNATDPFSHAWMEFYLSVFVGSRIFFSVCLLGGVLNVIHSYRTAREEFERRKLRWIMLGLAVAPLIYVLLWQVPSVWFTGGFITEEALLLIMSIIPITFGISIIRYHTFNIDLIFKRTTVYVLVLATLLTVYVLFIGTAAAMLDTLTVSSSLIVSAGAAVIVALIFEPLRRRVIVFVDKSFFRTQYNYHEAVRLLTGAITNSYDTSSLAESVAGHLDGLLQVERIAFVVRRDGGDGFFVASGRNFENPNREAILHLGLFNSVLPNIPSAADESIEPGIESTPLNPVPAQHLQIVLMIPIVRREGGLIGCILLGRKRAGVRFSREDVDLLMHISDQCRYALERIVLQERLILKSAETQRLAELNRMKSYFVSSVSHELKTPLTSIRMFAELLRTRGRNTSKKAEDYLEIIEGESERLTRLIDNVLDYSKIERGVKEYTFQRISLHTVLRSVLRLFKYQLAINGFKLKLKLARTDSFIHADGDALIEAFMNLLSNSIKYSNSKKEITVSTRRGKSNVHISVSDRGIGIPQEDLPHIFEPYYRSHGNDTQNVAGAGLGLAIVQHIVAAHNGTISATSDPGKGSTFEITLPRTGARNRGRRKILRPAS